MYKMYDMHLMCMFMYCIAAAEYGCDPADHTVASFQQ